MGAVLRQKPIVFGGRSSYILNIFLFIFCNSIGFSMAMAFLFTDIIPFNIFVSGYLLGLFFTFLRLPQTNNKKIFELILIISSIYFTVNYILLVTPSPTSDHIILGFLGIGMSGATFLLLTLWRANAHQMIITREEVDENNFSLEIITKKLFHSLTENIIIRKGSKIVLKPANIPVMGGMGFGLGYETSYLHHIILENKESVKISPDGVGIFELSEGFALLFPDCRVIFQSFPKTVPRWKFIHQINARNFELEKSDPVSLEFSHVLADPTYKRGIHPHTIKAIPYILIGMIPLLLGIAFLTLIYREVFVWDNVFNREHLNDPMASKYYPFISVIFILGLLLFFVGIYPILKIITYVFGKVTVDQTEDMIMVKYSLLGLVSLKFNVPLNLNPKIILLRKNYFLQLLSKDKAYYSVYLGRIR